MLLNEKDYRKGKMVEELDTLPFESISLRFAM